MKEFTLFVSKNERFSLSFAWYDLWIGLFFNTDKKILYFCPIPTLLFSFFYGKMPSRKEVSAMIAKLFPELTPGSPEFESLVNEKTSLKNGRLTIKI